MVIRPITTLGDPRLRTPGREVARFDRELGVLIDDMIETMDDAPGVGLAAQQVGVDLRVCVIRIEDELYEVVNPEIVHLSGEDGDWEGCLSVPGFRAWRVRAEHAVMTGRDRHGRKLKVSGHGLLARAIQHEFDHLHGEIYIDKLPAGQEILTEEQLDERLQSERKTHRLARIHRRKPVEAAIDAVETDVVATEAVKAAGAAEAEADR